MRRAAVVLACVLSLPACSLLEPHAPPPAVASQSDLNELNEKIDALAGKLSGTLSSAVSGNMPGAAVQGAETATGVVALSKEYGVSIPDVLLAVLMSLGGVRFWRGSIKNRKGMGATVTMANK